MDLKLLNKILEHDAFQASENSRYEVQSNYSVTVLLATHSTMSISKVKAIEASDNIVILETTDSTYLMPQSHLFGLKIEESSSSPSGRTGFLA